MLNGYRLELSGKLSNLMTRTKVGIGSDLHLAAAKKPWDDLIREVESLHIVIRNVQASIDIALDTGIS